MCEPAASTTEMTVLESAHEGGTHSLAMVAESSQALRMSGVGSSDACSNLTSTPSVRIVREYEIFSLGVAPEDNGKHVANICAELRLNRMLQAKELPP